MSTGWLLTLFMIGFPIIVTLILGRWGNEVIQRRATAVTLGLVSLSVLALFLIGSQPWLISSLLLSVILVFVTILREANDRNDYSFFLLLNSAWAVIVLPNSWVTNLFGLTMLLIVVSRWTKARGASVGFVVSRNDHGNDWGPK
jgi:MFS family permease